MPPARARDGVFDGWGSVLGTDMPTCTRGWGNVSLSDSLGRDSRAVRALAYVVMGRGFDEQEAGTENRPDGNKHKWRAAVSAGWGRHIGESLGIR